MNETDYGIQKVYDRAGHNEEDLLVPETIRNDSIEAPQETRLAHVGSEKDYIEAVSHDVVNGNKVQEVEAQRANKYNNMLETRQNNLNPSEEINEPISHTEKSGPVEKHNDPNGELVHQSILKNLESDAQNGSYQERCENSSPGNKVGQVEWSQKDADQSERARDKLPSDKTDDFEVNQKQNVGRLSEGAGQHQVVRSDTQNGTETGQLDDNSDLFQQHKTVRLINGMTEFSTIFGGSSTVRRKWSAYAQYDENGQLLQYQEDDPKAQQYAEGQLHDNEMVNSSNSTEKTIQIKFSTLKYDESGQPIPQYDENGQLIQRYQEGDPNVEQYAVNQLQYEKVVNLYRNMMKMAIDSQYQEDDQTAGSMLRTIAI
nr:unnamed protein product [Callosobruchus chinensis]